jgi:hypothetical protein
MSFVDMDRVQPRHAILTKSIAKFLNNSNSRLLRRMT